MMRWLLLLGWLVIASIAIATDAELDEVAITAEDREHWAFAPLEPVSVPRVENSAWPRNSIDRFILAELERAGLTPSPPADRPTLLRRLSFDLIGLPPTPEELAGFEQDSSPHAYERQVQRLLASPEYGKRWAQHWLDVARFAESDGFEHDKTRPDAWKYRDWVIEAFNRDLPYDQFIASQIAGDLHGGRDRIATLFCLSGPDMPDVNDQIERRHQLLNELTATVGSVVLGLQFGCAVP